MVTALRSHKISLGFELDELACYLVKKYPSVT